MMISNHRAFEEWMIDRYPLVFNEWELEASHLMDLDEFVRREYHEVWDEWRGELE